MRRYTAAVLALAYLLGSYKGYLALWEDGKPEPCQIFPCPVDSLPEEDRRILEEGIPARSRIELDQILEEGIPARSRIELDQILEDYLA